MNPLREQLAALEHEPWAHWTRYLLDHLTPENVERWRRQCETPYDQLTEAEKASDRAWADRVLAITTSRSQALLGNTRREAPLREPPPAGSLHEAREAELPDLRSQAELGNEKNPSCG